MESGYYRKKKGPDWRGLLRRLLRNRKLLLALCVGFPLTGFLLFGSHGLVRRARLAEQAGLEADIKEKKEAITRLRAESRALEGDRRAIEKVAREKYGMVRQGETAYRVQPAP